MAVSGTLRRGLDGMCGLERLDPLGKFGNARRAFAALLGTSPGQSGLELIAQDGQFGQVSIMREGCAESGLVVAELGLRRSPGLAVRVRIPGR